MKKLILLSLTIISSSFQLFAQSEGDYIEMVRDVLKLEKKAAIAEAMQLSDAESTPFWNLYNEYEAIAYSVQNKRIAIIKDFSDNYENLSDEKADEIYTNYLKYQKEILKLKNTYYKKFKKIVPAGKAARFMQAENKIETMVNASLALDIPLIETK